jgi:hypothetical protein
MRRTLPVVPLRVMTGYLPCWHATSREELAVPLDCHHGARALQLAADMGLKVIA